MAWIMDKIVQGLNKIDLLPGKKRILGGVVAAITASLLRYFPDLPLEQVTEVLNWIANAIFAWGIAAVYARGKVESK